MRAIIIALSLIIWTATAHAEECTDVVESVELEVEQLSSQDQAVVSQITKILAQDNAPKVFDLANRLANDPRYRLEDKTAFEFWQEVLVQASLSLQSPSCSERVMALAFHVDDLLVMDMTCYKEQEELAQMFDEEVQGMIDFTRKCLKEDPAANARFDRAQAYLYGRFGDKYKCKCEGGQGAAH
jgi:hypothetical protein